MRIIMTLIIDLTEVVLDHYTFLFFNLPIIIVTISYTLMQILRWFVHTIDKSFLFFLPILIFEGKKTAFE